MSVILCIQLTSITTYASSNSINTSDDTSEQNIDNNLPEESITESSLSDSGNIKDIVNENEPADKVVEEENEETDETKESVDEALEAVEEESTNQKNEVENVDSGKNSTDSTETKVSIKSTTIYQGIALQSPTHVYSDTSLQSKSLKSYEQGTVLKFQSYSNEWYEATVYINGKPNKGYIHKNHVETVDTSNQKNLEGIALQNPTKIYKSASTSSGTWKTYQKGTILKFKSFSANWYVATVYVNGEARTGYIHKSHVETVDTSNQVDFKGIALRDKTYVYKHTSTSLGSWKSYEKGSILSYKSYSSNWYVATVYVNGKARTGYIHKSHVENADKNQVNKKGIALINPTAVYSKANTNSSKHKTYSAGTILNFKTFSKNWYEATVYVDGKAKVGYIYRPHVELAYDKQEDVKGLAKKSPTRVYSSPVKSASQLRTYRQYHVLNFKTFSPNWYEATVNIDGKWVKGYLHKDDVTIGTFVYKNYDISLEEALEKQMAVHPKTTYSKMYVHKDALKKDKNGKWKVVGTNWNVRSGPGTNYEILGKLDEDLTNDTIVVYGQEGDFYRFSTWIIATKEATKPYLDPTSFTKGTPEYLQFLVLDQQAGLSETVINERILKGKGVLEGKASSFIKAAKEHNINEIYLIAHAMLETGHGTSDLAKGDEYNGKVVYNMYGIGAADGCDSPYQCGLKYAYEQGWDTPEKAIIGGAEWIYNRYIGNGKNTLYKMRWNPDGLVRYGYANGQYATDIAWAVKQTRFINQYYELLDDYTLVLEIPVYKK